MRVTTTTLTFLAIGAVMVVACGGTPEPGPGPVELGVPVAETTAGTLEGVWADETDEVSVFRGVAFAQPPVGDLRWRPPVPVESWNGTRMATEFGPACWQAVGADDSPYARGDLTKSEDCLTLNVWTPSLEADARRPVMVWFHGGGHSSGVGSAKIFDGTAMARKGVIMVTANYRLGPLGFLAHPALTAESPHESSGNYGILDHVATLEWVRDNIAAFGGDPGNVTIFGQSAGSWSVCVLQVSPLARGLFHKAIGHSGGCFGEPRLHLSKTGGTATAVSGHDAGLAIAAELGAEGDGPEAAVALRAAGPEAVMDAQRAARRGTAVVVDGWVMPRLADAVFATGEQNNVPIIVGSMSDEGTTLYAGTPELPREEFIDGLRAQYGGRVEALLAAYTVELDVSTKTAGQAMSADRNFTWQMRAWARATGDSNDVYQYFFSHAPPVFRLYVPDRPELDLPDGQRGNGAYHSGDLAYAFGNVGLVGIDWNDRDRELSDQISQYWVNFATTGNPNGEGLPVWPKYDREHEAAIEFGTDGTVAVSAVREEKLDLFDRSYQSSSN